MRISNSQRWGNYADRISETQARMVQAGVVATDGKKMHKISDDPRALAQVLDIRGYKSSVEGYTANVSRGVDLLKSAEAALSEVSTLTSSAMSLAVSGANTSTESSARQAMATQIDELRKRVIGLANSKSAEGNSLFAGQMLDKTPFTIDSTGLVYNGDANSLLIESDSNETLPANVDASEAFTNLYNRLTQLSEDLRGGNITAIGDQRLAEMKASVNDIATLRGQIGARQNAFETRAAAHSRRIEELTTRASDLEEVDFAQALTDYQAAQTTYSAALAVTSSITQTSLLDYIR